MQYEVLFVSKTGNTEEVAKAVYQGIPSRQKDIRRLERDTAVDTGETYFIGFWTNRGSCSIEVLDFISELHGKNIALFGTCGMGCDIEYYKMIEKRVRALIPDDNVYLGTFLCQGKMSMHVRDKYEELLKSGQNDNLALHMLHNFDEALLHPNQEDLQMAAHFAANIVEKLEACQCQRREEQEQD